MRTFRAFGIDARARVNAPSSARYASRRRLRSSSVVFIVIFHRQRGVGVRTTRRD